MPSQEVVAQEKINNPNLGELPIILSWDNDGVRITTKSQNRRSANLLKMIPSRYLEQIGNDLIRVTLDAGGTPVIVDLSNFYIRPKPLG